MRCPPEQTTSGARLARDGVVGRAAGEGGHAHRRDLGGGVDRPGEELYGVAALEVDVDAGVAAAEAGDGDRQGRRARRHRGLRHRQVDLDRDAAGAADVDRALLLGVEVQEAPAGEEVGAELGGAGQAGLLVEGEEELERAVDHVVRGDEGEHRGDADAVVRAEGGAVGGQVVALAQRPDRVGREVEVDVGVLLLDHVEVRLEDGRGGVLVAGRAGYHDQHVAGRVALHLEAVRRGDLADVVAHPPLVLRGPRNGEDLVEVLPELFGLEVGDEGHGGSLPEGIGSMSDRWWRDRPRAGRGGLSDGPGAAEGRAPEGASMLARRAAGRSDGWGALAARCAPV